MPPPTSPTHFSLGRSLSWAFHELAIALMAGWARMDKSISINDTLQKIRKHKLTLYDGVHFFHFCVGIFWLYLMKTPDFPPLKFIIGGAFLLGCLIPFTSQFLMPATPVLAWVITYFCSRFLPVEWRPTISVIFLPTLETVLYGANISDILTRFTHPFLDILAWIPYGVGHFSIPFIVGIFLWLFRTKQALHNWGRTFGYMNFTGVVIQLLFPCAPPWYEVVYGLTPANYGIRGNPGGLVRIDRLLGLNIYTGGFANGPLVFGAFPSLHAGSATVTALYVSHFFPHMTRYIWTYTTVLYWATMYLTHHYLIDVVTGGCIAVLFFYILLPKELRGSGATAPPPNLQAFRAGRSKYELYDLEAPPLNGNRGMIAQAAADFELSDASSDVDAEEEVDITYRRSSPSIPAKPFGHAQRTSISGKKSHRHTASIASLIGGDQRSPVSNAFVFPPTPTRATMGDERER